MHDMTIVGSDGRAPSRAAADWAADRAVRSEGTLVLVRVLEPAAHETDQVFAQRVSTAEASLHVESQRIGAPRPGLETIIDVVRGDPGERLRQMSFTTNLVAVGSPARRPGGSSVVDRLVAGAAGPVAVVPVVPAGDTTPVSGIVVGIDGTEASLAALAFAADEALRWGEPLEAVHAWLDLPVLSSLGAVATTVVTRVGAHGTTSTREDPQTTLLRMQHRQLLHEALATAALDHPGLVVNEHVVQGAAAQVLLDAARFHRALVVGNHGRKRIARFLLGSVSHAAVLAVAGPTVVVRSQDDTA